jgi:hypothetical protein
LLDLSRSPLAGEAAKQAMDQENRKKGERKKHESKRDVQIS